MERQKRRVRKRNSKNENMREGRDWDKEFLRD